LISVIIPCYRCQETVERALDSVLAQSLQPAEIFLIDDASGDGTLDLLRDLERLHTPLVRVISLAENGGPGLARNAGWDAASQPWIAFLDADDAWHPRKLEIQWSWLSAHPEVDLCGHATQTAIDSIINYPVDDAPAARRLTLTIMLYSNRLPTRSVILRRSLPNRFSKRRFSEDYQLWLQIIQSGKVACRLEVPLACSFRPEFSPGGQSAQLWEHEKNELAVLQDSSLNGKVNPVVIFSATIWSIVKYGRRKWIMWRPSTWSIIKFTRQYALTWLKS
jgi:hypothetical protein